MSPSRSAIIDSKEEININPITFIFKEATFPIVNIICDDHYFIQGLSAVSLGCDVFCKGIPGVGPRAVYIELQNIYRKKKQEQIKPLLRNCLLLG